MMINRTQNVKHKTQNAQQNIMETKKIYRIPRVEIIYLDNEISLALQSAPPN